MKKNRTNEKLAYGLAWIAGLILVLLPFHAFLTTWVGSNTGHLDLVKIWKEIIITLMAIPAIWLGWHRPDLRRWLLKSPIARLIYFYFLLTIITGLWALSRHQVNKTALIYALIINLRFLGFFLVCLIIGAYNRLLTDNWHKLLLIPAGLVIVFGLAQRFVLPYDFLKHFGYSKKTIPPYQTVDASIDYRRLLSTLRGANPLGAYLSFILPSALVIKKPFQRALFIAAGLVVLFYSYSRSAWLGLALAIAVIAWVKYGRHINWRVVAAAALVLAAAALLGVAAFSSNRSLQETLFHISSSSASPQSSNAIRLNDMKTAAGQIIHQPLGRGPGTAGPASFRNIYPPRIAENYYLQLGQEVGIIGMAVFIAINALVAWRLWGERHQPLHLVLLATLVGISFINLVSHAWTDDTLSLLWWGLAGAAFGSILKGKHNGRVQART